MDLRYLSSYTGWSENTYAPNICRFNSIFSKNFLPISFLNDRIYSKDPPEKEQRVVERVQKGQSVMVWAGVCATGKTPLIFVEPGVKINRYNYMDMLDQDFFPWAESISETTGTASSKTRLQYTRRIRHKTSCATDVQTSSRETNGHPILRI